MAWLNHISGGNVRAVLKIAFPLILAAAGHMVNLFADRTMLANYSQEAVNASFPAGIAAFALSCFFVGTVGYTGVFVAQYFGAAQFQRIGVAVWQGIWLALSGGALLALGYFWAPYLFAAFKHTPTVTELEISYYRILAVGTVIPLLNNALSAFWAGRGKTVMIMAVNILVAAVNIPCNYLLIYGNELNVPFWGKIVFPEMGIAGAAWGTNLAGAIGLIIYALGFFTWRHHREKYGSWHQFFDAKLLRRMLRYGAPNGVQLFIDLVSFEVFIVLVGRISPAVQEAATLAFTFNALAMMPVFGLGQAVSILVGKAIGAADIMLAQRSVISARLLMLVYMAVMVVFFVARPEWIMWVFEREGDAKQAATIPLAFEFLRYITVYLFFDGIYVIYSNAIRGAGDTKFTMWMNMLLCVVGLGVPSIIYGYLSNEANGLWIIFVLYVILSGFCFYGRYRGGKWQKMKVIESAIVITE
jgi:MATE family multidrug resistance protein